MIASDDGDEWRLYYSPEGYPYYYNHSTGESRWAEFQSLIETDLGAISPQDDDNDYGDDEEEDDSDLGSTESESVSSEDVESTSSFDEFLMSDEGWAQFESEQAHVARRLQVDTSLQIYNIVEDIRKRLFAAPSGDEMDELNSYEIDEDLSEVSSADSDVQELRAPFLPPVIVSLSDQLTPLIRSSFSLISSLAMAAMQMLQQSPFYTSLHNLFSAVMRNANQQRDSEDGSNI